MIDFKWTPFYLIMDGRAKSDIDSAAILEVLGEVSFDEAKRCLKDHADAVLVKCKDKSNKLVEFEVIYMDD